jgi:hypothetical protein
MNQLQELKQELESLTKKVNKVLEADGDKISLTKQQLVKLLNYVVDRAHSETMDSLIGARFDAEDYAELDLNGFELSLSMDDSGLLGAIKDQIETPEVIELDNLDDIIEEADI